MSCVTQMQKLRFRQSLKDTMLIIAALENFVPGIEDDEHASRDDVARVQELIELMEVRRDTIVSDLWILGIDTSDIGFYTSDIEQYKDNESA